MNKDITHDDAPGPEPRRFTCPDCPEFATDSYEEYRAHREIRWEDLPKNQPPTVPVQPRPTEEGE